MITREVVEQFLKDNNRTLEPNTWCYVMVELTPEQGLLRDIVKTLPEHHAKTVRPIAIRVGDDGLPVTWAGPDEWHSAYTDPTIEDTVIEYLEGRREN